MKLVIDTFIPKEEVRLSLEPAINNNGIVLCAGRSEGGFIYSLLTFYDDGTICYHSDIDPTLGFDLDDQGRLKINT